MVEQTSKLNNQMSEMQRESAHRHRSERLIDRFLISAEISRATDLKKKLAQLDKRNNFAAIAKRQKVELEKAKQQKLEEKFENKEKLQEKYA